MRKKNSEYNYQNKGTEDPVDIEWCHWMGSKQQNKLRFDNFACFFNKLFKKEKKSVNAKELKNNESYIFKEALELRESFWE